MNQFPKIVFFSLLAQPPSMIDFIIINNWDCLLIISGLAWRAINNG